MDVRCTLKKNSDFRRLYTRGKSAVNPYMVVYCRRSKEKNNRLGYTVSTKLGHAVVRNRTRRRLREIYRLHEDEMVCGRDIVVVARVRAADSTYRQLEKSFLHLAEKLELLKKEQSGE